MNQPQQQPTFSEFKKSKDFDGVMEWKYFVHIKEPDGKSRLMGIVGHTREQLNTFRENMKKKHDEEKKSLDDVFLVLDKKEEEVPKLAVVTELPKEEQPKIEGEVK